MKIPLGAIVLAFLAIHACSPPTDIVEKAERPYDPWVIRSVLDQKPRILTAALHDNLWVAYHTEQCALYKAWKGYVDYEGAVFNTAHGPQPVSVGDAFLVNVFDHPWQLASGGDNVPTQTQYLGHRFREGHVELMYALSAPDAPSIRVYERIEYVEDVPNQPGFERVFTTENVPDEYVVKLKTNVNSIASKRNIHTDGELIPYEEEEQQFGNLNILEIEGELVLNSNAETEFTTFFVGKPTIKNRIQANEGDDETMPLGYRLIARNDCKTCHNTNVKTIGPAYVEIAQRYPNTTETVRMLVNKVIKGGTGIWGLQVMNAHPDLSETDARAMVQYILSLNKDESGAETAIVGQDVAPDTSVSGQALLPGTITQIHTFRNPLERIPPMPHYRPYMAGVMQEFNNIRDGDFKELSDNFALYANGYLYAPDSGRYTIRLWSDDGSRLTIRNQVVIDNDETHGTESKEITLGLQRGYYPMLLEYFQGTGGKFLSLNWRRPGATDFEVIPAQSYFHHPDQQINEEGLTLPMSIIRRIPGDEFALEDVHPSYDLFQARPDDFLPKVGGMDFLDDGRLVVCTWDPTGSVYILDNPDAGDPNEIGVRRIAQGLAEPLGLKVVDGDIYVLQKQELTRLVDTDGDDVIDEYQMVSNDWLVSSNFHEFAFGLEYAEGYFYCTLATAIEPGGASSDPQIPDRGKVVKISAEDGTVEFIAHGLRTPNGIGFGVDGQLFVADNQGDWLPSSKIVHVQPGAWYGSRSVDYEGTADLEETLPVVWLPQDEIGNSPSTPALLDDGPYAGQMMHGEVTHGGLKRVFVEEIEGAYQGAVFRFTQGLEAGINRITKGPDGSWYVGGIGNPGNWAQTGKLWYGLQRLRYNGNPTFEMLAVRARSDGVEVEFTEPLEEGDGWDPEDFEVLQWQYIPTANYGGPKENLESLDVLSCNVSGDRTRVFLELDGMKEDRVVYIHLRDQYISAAGRQLWSTEAWYTMNRIPPDRPGFRSTPTQNFRPNALTTNEKENGWKLLFDGTSLDGWKRYGKEDIGKSWIVEDGTIKLNAKKDENGKWFVEDRGDLMTRDAFENFELRLEWKISNCGNSGIIYSVVESAEYPESWHTGPEMQILDNTCHPDSRYPTHRAGDLYDMIECKYVSVKPAGEWNKVRLIKNDGHVEHWLNGIQVVTYQMYTDAWDALIANSKFSDLPDFGQAREGHIVLQDHGDAQVWFRNVKIRGL